MRGRLELIDVKERSAGRSERSIVKRPRCRDRRIHRLINIAIAEKLRAVRADVANLQYAVAEKFVLQIQVVVLNVGRPQIPINREDIRVKIIGKDRHTVLNYRESSRKKTASRKVRSDCKQDRD